MGEAASEMLETGEKVLFDKRHSLWEIWKNFLIGGIAVVVLVLLLTRFKPGPSATPGETKWGYIVLVSLLAFASIVFYGVWPMIKRRKLPEKELFLPIICMILAAAAWGALMWFRNSRGFGDVWETAAWIAFVVVIVGWLAYPVLRWFFTHFILTDRKLILSSGILNKSFKVIPLDQVNDISGSQNVWERVFNYGDLVIESAGEFGQQPFTNVGDPRKLRSQILEQRRIFLEERASRPYGTAVQYAAAPAGEAAAQAAQAAQETSARGAAAAELDLVEGIRRLDELRRSGALSEEEFQKAKRELLDRLEGN